MLPLVTNWPPKRLMPSLWPCESRPFVDDPPPFLCAMTNSRSLVLRPGCRAFARPVYRFCMGFRLGKLNVADFDGCVVLSVAAQNLVLACFLELHDLELGAAHVGDDLAGHLGLGDSCARNNLLFVRTDRENFVKRHFAANVALQALDANLFARHGAVLLASTANYGVHASSHPILETSIVAAHCRGRQSSLASQSALGVLESFSVLGP